MEEDGGGLVGDGKMLAGCELAESRAGEPEGSAVIGLRCSHVVPSVDGFFH